jgi:excinuclease UvrABC nuclease subunit
MLLPYAGSARWISFNPLKPNNLPPHAACYAISVDGRVVYVGQTLNLRSRFYSHRLAKRGDIVCSPSWGELGSSVSMKAKFGQKYGDWAMREARLISRLKPRFNRRSA